MGHSVCCVFYCKNNGLNCSENFYRFPLLAHKKDQREKWIAAVNQKNSDGTPWFPKVGDRICGAHFIGNKKSDTLLSPSYVPTLFSTARGKINNDAVHHKQKLQRHDRFMARRGKNFKKLSTTALLTEPTPRSELTFPLSVASQSFSETDTQQMLSEMILGEQNGNLSAGKHNAISSSAFADKSCQVDTSIYSASASNTSVIVKYVKSGSIFCDAEVQTDIYVKIVPKVVTTRNMQCGTPHTEVCDQRIGPDCSRKDLEQPKNSNERSFCGFSSIKKNEQLLDLAGVSINNFNFLLGRFTNSDKWKVNKEDRLLIFLTKLKTGMTYRALGVVFSLHRTTVSDIFLSLLTTLCEATQNLVPWVNRDIVQYTMPECFKETFPDTRVIIDCTEFRVEIPATVEDRVYTYSHYKKGFTAKALIGIAPSGLITLKSRAAGGRKSDSQITIESGLISLLEDGDLVLADKGFPSVREKIDEHGKKCFLVMPPFLEGNEAFTKEEAESTYKIASVRIHVERIMQRLRTYRVLDKIPENLFSYIDDILHICCVLVNLQPPIMSTDSNDK